MNQLYPYLRTLSAADWHHAIETLILEIHPIDRNATRIWFAFHPLELHVAFEETGDPQALARQLRLMGRWRLTDDDLIDSSHRFLYSHRYWPQVKNAIHSYSGAPQSLQAVATAIADAAGRTTRVDRDQLVGLVLVGLMTLRQAGPAAFAAAAGRVHLTPDAKRMSPHQVMRLRSKDDWQGFAGLLRGLRRRWTVIFDENDPAARFDAVHEQELATAAQTDRRDYREVDARCTRDEGPIPVECRAASCGTCWVGVLAGAEKLSPVVDREEGQPLRRFGYTEASDPQPLIRLACQARARGSVSIVIPPWNGFIGKLRRLGSGKL